MIAALAGLALGVLLAALWWRARQAVVLAERDAQQRAVEALRGEKAALEQAREAQAAELRKLAAAQAALQAQLEARDHRLAEQKAWIDEQNHVVELRFARLANQLLEDKSQKFTDLNRKQIDAIIGPFKEQLGEFRQRVDAIYQTDSMDRTELRGKIDELTRLNQNVSRKTEDLTRALTVTSKSVGDWGETILKRILEQSGLRQGHEYELQMTVSSDRDEDARQRPDAVITLPEGRKLVVDAKVSNKAWTDYRAGADEAERDSAFLRHLASLRAHIKGLAARDYARSPDLAGSVDFVLLFVPVEGALLEALARAPELYDEAYKQRVILVVPTTLMAVVKLVEGMWTVQRQKENFAHIAEAGARLYDKLRLFAESFEKVGAALAGAQQTYDQARGQLASGKGNAIGLAQKMVQLGVKPPKGRTLPLVLGALAGEGEAGEGADPEDSASSSLTPS